MYTLIVTLCSLCQPVVIDDQLPSLEACRQRAAEHAQKMRAWAERSHLVTFQTTMCRRNQEPTK